MQCKSCCNEYRREWIKTLKGKAYASKHNKKWYAKNREKVKKYYQEWYAKNGRNRNPNWQEVILKWKKEHPERIVAISKLNRAVQNRKIIKPRFCQNCGKEKRLSGHHENYAEPLKVIWLCYSCHKREHSK